MLHRFCHKRFAGTIKTFVNNSIYKTKSKTKFSKTSPGYSYRNNISSAKKKKKRKKTQVKLTLNFHSTGTTKKHCSLAFSRHFRNANWRKLVRVNFCKDFWDCYQGQRKNWPTADKGIPCNYPRTNCGTYFGSSCPLLFLVANGQLICNISVLEAKTSVQFLALAAMKNQPLTCSLAVESYLIVSSDNHLHIKRKKTKPKYWNFFVTFPYLTLVDTQMLRTWNRIISTPTPFPCKILNYPSRSKGQLHTGMEVTRQIGQDTRLAIRRVLGLRPTLTNG